MKRCSHCIGILSLENFGKNKSQKDGLDYVCKNCIKEYRKKYYWKNINKIKERVKEYYQKHPQKRCQN